MSRMEVRRYLTSRTLVPRRKVERIATSIRLSSCSDSDDPDVGDGGGRTSRQSVRSRAHTPGPTQRASARFKRTPSGDVRRLERTESTSSAQVLITQVPGEEDDGRNDLDLPAFSSEGEEDEGLSSTGSPTPRDHHPDGYDTDLEIDDGEYLRGGDEEFDPTGVHDYIKECNRVGVIPVSYFMRHVHDREFNIRYHGLGPLGARAIAKPFEVNTAIERINIEGNCIEADGAKYIGRMLRENLYITELVLAENDIGSEGAEAVCNMMLENQMIKVLDLSGNRLKDSDGEQFYRVLEKNNTLRKLYLSHNHFETKAAGWFREGLAVNESLQTLDLSWNHFRLKGAILIADAVRENYGLKYLKLSMNGLGYEGAKTIGHALKHNQSLEDLDLSRNRINAEAAIEIAKGLKVNDVLRSINLSHNPISITGTTPLMMAIQRNENSVLSRMVLLGIMVEEEFENIMNQVIDVRPIEVIHSGILLAKAIVVQPPNKVDAETLYWNDPMTKLKKHAAEKGYRLIDLFKEFDVDQSWTVTREEFTQGVAAAKISLTEAEIEILINRLDQDGDGEVDYKELCDGDEDNRLARRQVYRIKAEEAERAKSQSPPPPVKDILDDD